MNATNSRHAPKQLLCGCSYSLSKPNVPRHIQRSYLPLRGMKAHTTIKDVASRTVLTQTFSNDSNELLKNIVYSFPLYDGVSVVSFTATIGDVRIRGIVKEKQQARREYHDAVNKGSAAGLLEQLPEASDVFVTRIGNVPAGARVIIEVIYIGELKHDAQSNGMRFTIPSFIAPRYGATPDDILSSPTLRKATDAIEVVVDFESPEGCPIQQIQSPSHPITVSIGRTTNMAATTHMANRGSATLSLDTTTLDSDFVVIASIKDADIPKALLETHATIPNQRALMATLVPRFNITPTYGEIVFIVDRSGSMDGKMDLVIRAMTILLKSLPVGTKFNICSFGSHYSFLWPRSKSYNDANLNEALNHIDAFDSDFGGTEMHQPVEATISQRFSDMLLDAIVLTDGQIWNQESLFDMIQKASADYKCRFFSLGIGSGASTALVEGIATAGNGFSQFVAEGEKMDMKMVRLLKGALTPHIDDYNLEVKYKQDNDDFEIIDSMKAASKVDITVPPASKNENAPKPPISFFDNKLNTDSDGEATMTSTKITRNKFAHLPVISPPSVLQAPCRLPPLYPFSRTTVYILLDPNTYHRTPEALILRATCPEGPLELEIKVEDIGKGETINQLAAKKAVSELEKTGGWLATATDRADGALIKNKHDGRWEEIVECEAVRLGVKYHIAGKWCSFVAVEGDVEHEAVVFGAETPLPSMAPLNLAPPGSSARMPAMAAMSSLKSKIVRSVDANAVQPAPRRLLASKAARRSASKTETRSREEFSAEELVTPMAQASMAFAYRVSASGPVNRNLNLESARRPRARSHGDNMHEIIRLQKSDGSWEWDPRLLSILGINPNPGTRNAIVATALAIAFFKKRMAHEAESWELIVEKARTWLGQQHGVDVEKEISDAEKLFGSESI
ncbi:von Willebrand factor type A domain-containing protein [Ustulina deusta]|nr:von Willebrand factor type A domain-containing protein [Ustulina deusta]